MMKNSLLSQNISLFLGTRFIGETQFDFEFRSGYVTNAFQAALLYSRGGFGIPSEKILALPVFRFSNGRTPDFCSLHSEENCGLNFQVWLRGWYEKTQPEEADGSESQEKGLVEAI